MRHLDTGLKMSFHETRARHVPGKGAEHRLCLL